MASITQMRGAVVISVALSLFTSAGLAQVCEPAWVPGEGVPGVNGWVNALTQWDPDGAGPLAPRLVTAGNFTEAGRIGANHIASWDGSQWAALGTLNRSFNAVVTLDNGELVAGGGFSSSTNSGTLVRFDGQDWQPIDTPNGSVNTLASLPGGGFVVGGDLSFMGTLAVGRVGVYRNGAWESLLSGVTTSSSSVDAVAVGSDGSIIAGGRFSSIGFIATSNIARWNGSGWVALGAGLTGQVRAIEVLANGDIVAASTFRNSQNVEFTTISLWNGSAWTALGPNQSGRVQALEVDAAGVLWAGGFRPGGFEVTPRLIRWTGTAWENAPVAASGYDVRALRTGPDGGMIVGGYTFGLGEIAATGIGRIDGAVATALGDGGIDPIDELFTLPSGEILSLGFVPTLTGALDRTLIRWNGARWERFSATSPTPVVAAAVAPNGDIIAASGFPPVGGSNATRVARFNGSTWQPIGSGFSGIANDVVVRQDGTIFVVGGITGGSGPTRIDGVATWNGTSWVGLGARASARVGFPYYSAITPDGKLVIAGDFTAVANTAASKVALWDEEEGWSALGSGVTGTDTVLTVTALSDGRIAIGGAFSTAGGVPARNIAVWNGNAWGPLGPGVAFGTSPGFVSRIAEFPNGQIVAVGTIRADDASQSSGILRWDGASWTGYGSGLWSARNTGSTASLVLPLGNGDLITAGSLFRAGENVSARFARWSQSGAPAVALPPLAAELVAGSDVSLVAAATAQTVGVSYRWERETESGSGVFVALADGPGGASPGGGVVVGAAGVLANPTDGAPIQLVISNAAPSDSASYRVVLFNACGQRESVAAAVTVRSRCEYDYNGDENIDLGDAQLMAQVAVGLITPDPAWLDGDLNGDGLSDLTDAQQLAQYVITGTCGV